MPTVQEYKDIYKQYMLSSFRNFIYALDIKDGGKSIIHPNPLYDHIIDVLDKREKNILLCLPRKFGKSFFAALLCCYLMLTKPNMTILIVSDTFAKVKIMVNGIRNIFNHPTILKYFGKMLIKGEKEGSAFKVKTRTTTKKEDNLFCISLKTQMQAYRVDLLICDDIVGQDYSVSRAVKERTDRNYQFLLPLLEESGKMIYIGTRFAKDDLIAQIHELNTRIDKWIEIVESVYDEFGNIKYPDILSEEFIELQRNSLSNAIFSSQYLNTPIVEGETVFNIDTYTRYDDISSILPSIQNVYFGVDMATGRQAENGDSSAIVVIGKTENNFYYVLDCYASKEKIDDFYNALKRLNEQWKPKEIFIEAIGGFAVAYQHIQTQTRLDNTHLPIREITSQNKNKNDRIETTLEPLLRNKTLILPSNLLTLANKHLNKLINIEMCSFNRFQSNNIDDCLDALELAIRLTITTISKRYDVINFG